jgi:hypothetical protein
MPAITGSAFRVMYSFAVLSGHGQVRQFRAVDDHQVDAIGTAAIQAFYIGQRVLGNRYGHFSFGQGPTMSP